LFLVPVHFGELTVGSVTEIGLLFAEMKKFLARSYVEGGRIRSGSSTDFLASTDLRGLFKSFFGDPNFGFKKAGELFYVGES
jgi:hypothetical protein